MNCKVAKEQTHACLDGQLTSAAVGELEEHLSICDNCREEMVFLKGLVDAIQEDVLLQPPVDFTKNVLGLLPPRVLFSGPASFAS